LAGRPPAWATEPFRLLPANAPLVEVEEEEEPATSP
jgi:hypothetical protein